MKTKTEKVLPKTLAGTVHVQFVRCGKLNCRCAKGELHGAYFYHFVRVNGKLTKRYLKAADVEEIRNACFLRQQQEKEDRERMDTLWNKLRELRENLRTIGKHYD